MKPGQSTGCRAPGAAFGAGGVVTTVPSVEELDGPEGGSGGGGRMARWKHPRLSIVSAQVRNPVVLMSCPRPRQQRSGRKNNSNSKKAAHACATDGVSHHSPRLLLGAGGCQRLLPFTLLPFTFCPFPACAVYGIKGTVSLKPSPPAIPTVPHTHTCTRTHTRVPARTHVQLRIHTRMRAHVHAHAHTLNESILSVSF